jgi:mannose-1-phosphate guanylyltransferase/mannose-6-phosphate isomerase
MFKSANAATQLQIIANPVIMTLRNKAKDMTVQIFPVVLCGGSGVRLWPLSRSMYPKQFIPSLNGQNETLLGSTLKRLTPELGFEPPTLLCNNDYRFLVQEELDRAGIAPREILLEQVARNTAPAIAVAALSISEQSPDAILAVVPSDHIVKDAAIFAESVRKAAEIAAHGRFVLFGIQPDAPHTGYGYIRRGDPLNESPASGGYQVSAFVEKPDLPTAERYLAEGGYYWNSGIFVLQASTFLKELGQYAPDIVEHAHSALAAAETDLGFRRLDASAYEQCPKISIDYALMEKTARAAVLPLNSGWSDVGSWSSLWEIGPHDSNGNTVRGDTMLVDTQDSYIHSQGALVATLGVQNLIVVQTPDAVLVADKGRAQEVGTLVQTLALSNRREQEQHLRNHRPWGFFETLSLGPRFQVKLLHVKPGAQLSLQMHHHRSEHWVVVKGTAMVTRNEERKLVCENESIYISATQWHQLENPGKVPLEIIEVQIGSYLGEDDIIRQNDIYQRADHETK